MTLETKAHTDMDVKTALGDILYTFEQFKEANDARLEAIERRGDSDPLLKEKIDRIDSALSRQQNHIERLSAAGSRPPLGTADGGMGPSDAKQAFDGYMRAGALAAPELKAIAASDSDGAVIAPEETASLIDARLRDVSPIRQIATVRQISANTYRKPMPTTAFGAGWAGETANRPETTTPTIQPLDFPAMELYAMPATTQTLLDDAVVDVSEWIADEVQTEFAVQESAAFVAGDGVAKPRGFRDYPTAVDASRTATQLGVVNAGGAAVTGDDLIELTYTVEQSYRQNGRFIVSRGTASAIRKLKDVDGNYLWSPGLSAGQPSTLIGFPVTESEDMPEIGASARPIAFGDFRRGYLIVDRAGIQVLRDPYSAKPYVLFYITKRVGGGVQDFNAIKFLQMPA